MGGDALEGHWAVVTLLLPHKDLSLLSGTPVGSYWYGTVVQLSQPASGRSCIKSQWGGAKWGGNSFLLRHAKGRGEYNTRE